MLYTKRNVLNVFSPTENCETDEFQAYSNKINVSSTVHFCQSKYSISTHNIKRNTFPIYIYIYVYADTYICLCIFIDIYTNAYTHAHAHMNVFVRVYIYIYIYT